MADPEPKQRSRFTLSEDWLAVVIAFLVILLTVIGLLGPNGIKVAF